MDTGNRGEENQDNLSAETFQRDNKQYQFCLISEILSPKTIDI